MAIGDDWSVDSSGNIRHISGTTKYSGLQIYRWLMDLADDPQASGNDNVDITSFTPAERSTDEIFTFLDYSGVGGPTYNISDDDIPFIYGCSITQEGGDTQYSGLKVLGAVNNSNTQLVVIQNNQLYQYTTTPSAPFWGDQSTGGYNGDAASGILMQIMLKSRVSGVDIDGKRIRVQARHWGDTYDFFNVTLGQGVAVAAIGTTPDAQNDTSQGTVTAYTHVTNTEGYQTIDLNNGNGAQPYYSQWSYTTNTSGDGLKGVWEFIKDLTGNGTSKTIHGVNGELFLGVTHEYNYNSESGNPFVEDDIITWGSGATAGTGLLLALDDNGTTGTVWMQLLTGVAPTNGMTVTNEAADGTHVLNGAPTLRTVPKIFLGSYTGTLIGAFGIGVAATDLTASDTVQNLLGVTQAPPNNVTFTLSGTVSGEDYVLVGPKDTGDVFKFDQFTTNATYNSAGITSIVVTTSIPSDTPSSGTIRIQLDSGIYRRVEYTSWTGSTFTIASTDFSGANAATAGNNLMISYIDKLADATSVSFTTIFSSPRDLYIRVRDGGASPIKTYQSPAVLTSAGGSAVASRITDA